MVTEPNYHDAEKHEFPIAPDDQVWCSIRSVFVGAGECASDACIAPEMRPVCWGLTHDGRPVPIYLDDNRD